MNEKLDSRAKLTFPLLNSDGSDPCVVRRTSQTFDPDSELPILVGSASEVGWGVGDWRFRAPLRCITTFKLAALICTKVRPEPSQGFLFHSHQQPTQSLPSRLAKAATSLTTRESLHSPRHQQGVQHPPSWSQRTTR